MKIGDSESEVTWSEFFTWLKGRGLRGVEIITSDDHGGLVKAIRKHFQGVSWQRCQTHFKRKCPGQLPKALQGELKPKPKHRKIQRIHNTIRRMENRNNQTYA